MGRSERPVDPRGGPLAEFASDLRALRRGAGSPTYRTMARQTHFSVTALSQAAAGTRLPSLAVTLAYVEACGGDSAQWRQRWLDLEADRAANQGGPARPATMPRSSPKELGVAAGPAASPAPAAPAVAAPAPAAAGSVPRRPGHVRRMIRAAVGAAGGGHGAARERDSAAGGTADGAADGAAGGAGHDRVVPRQLPAGTAYFAGRAAELKHLAALADPPGAAGTHQVIAVISGMPGVGKTTLAVHWAHEVADCFPDGQLYVNLRGFGPSGLPMPPGQAIGGFLGALGVPAARLPAGLEDQAALYRSLVAGKRVLAVLDNARDEQQVRLLLPGSPGCAAVVTSRRPLAGLVASHGAQSITLDVLSDEEAGELLARRLGPQRPAAELAAIPELAEHCANLPLALAIVAARAVTSPGLPLAGLVAELRESRRRLDALDVADSTVSVRHVFNSSYDALSSAAARMFRLLGTGPAQEISVPAAASLCACGQARARVLLGELTQAHLLAEHVPGRFAFHDLLRAYAAGLAHASDSDSDLRAALSRLLGYLLHAAAGAALVLNPQRRPVTLPAAVPGAEAEAFGTDAEALAWLEREYEVLLAAIGRAEEEGLDGYVWQLPWALTDLLAQQQGHWHDWIRLQRGAVAAAQRSGDRAGQAIALRALGQATATTGDYPGARVHLSEALDRYRDLGDPAGQAQIHGDLSVMYGLQDTYSQALHHATVALRISRDAGLPEQANALNSIGWYHAQLGDYQQALATCQQALALHREFASTFGQATTLDSIGYAHHHLGNHAAAIEHFQQAADLHARLGSRWQLTQTLTRLGDAHLTAGNRGQAAAAWRQALGILEDLHHPDADSLRRKLTDLQLQPV